MIAVEVTKKVRIAALHGSIPEGINTDEEPRHDLVEWASSLVCSLPTGS